MSDSRSAVASAPLALLAASLVMLAAGCGKKGPPLAPLRPVPARVDDLSIRRMGDDVYLQFTIPSRNADNTSPADLTRMEAYAITGKPEDPSGRSLDARDFLKYARQVAAAEVRPPPPPPPKEGPAPPPPPPDPRPAQGERVTLVETLKPDARTLFVHPLAKGSAQPQALSETDAERMASLPRPLVLSQVDILSRVYVVAGRSKKKEAGGLSARLAVPLSDVPDAPLPPSVRYDEAAVHLEWIPPATARRRPQDQPGADVTGVSGPAAGAPGSGGSASPASSPDATALAPLLARPIFPGVNPHTYNVYQYVAAPEGQILTVPTPINPRPLDVPRFDDTHVGFGVERCYIVRTVEAAAAVTLESLPSGPTCVTPRDTFPPAAPRSLAAVGAEGAVSLIWEANTDADLAGYIVLRGIAPGEKLEALTPSPIRETTFRDATGKPGVRYVYAVVAVDSASPQNVSIESNRVEEMAR